MIKKKLKLNFFLFILFNSKLFIMIKSFIFLLFLCDSYRFRNYMQKTKRSELNANFDNTTCSSKDEIMQFLNTLMHK